MIAAARFPLCNERAKSQFLRPKTHGLIWFSAQLLSMDSMMMRGICPLPAARVTE